MGSVRIVAGPQNPPITLAEARDQLRLTDDVEDALVSLYVNAATEHVEHFLHRALITQTRELVMDGFSARVICLPFPPVQSVTSIKYLDDDDVEQTLSASVYETDLYSSPARVAPKFGQVWPTLTPGLNRVRIRYVCGYGDTHDKIPETFRQGVRWLLGHLHEHREAVLVGVGAVELPLGLQDLLRPHVVHGA